MKTVLKWGTVLALASLAMVSCKVVDKDDGSSSTLSSAKFESDEISGWKYDASKFTDGFTMFTAGNMVGLINGGAQIYIDKGMTQGFQQMLKKGDEQTYLSWVMDFGTEAHSNDMYTSMIQSFTSTKEIAGSYPQTNAFVTPTTTGYDGYAVFGKYMVWISLDGFGGNLSEGKKETVEFLQTIEQKIKELGLI